MPAIRTHPRTTALEVTTDAPMPPTLSIISPTPRAFTFAAPAAPFLPSPSASPFEHGLSLKPLRLHTPEPPVRMLTPESAASASSPVFSSPSSSLRHSPAPLERPRSRAADAPLAAASFACKRRKSTGGVTEPSERRPKRGDDDYIKRPENAFILFRRKCVEERLAAQAAADEEAAAAAAADGPASKPKKHRQADLSKMISQQWRALGAEERTYWEQLAKEKKKEHEKMYPGYVYRPQRTKRAKSNAVPPSKKGKGRADEGLEEVEESVEFQLPLAGGAAPARHGRSSSAPNGAIGTQTIRLPVVHMPSAPSSPLLLPTVPLNAIGRRPSVDWGRPAPHRPLEAQAVQSLFQPQYMMQSDASMDFQQSPFYAHGMYEISAAPGPLEQPSLAPLMMPPTFFPGNPSPFSPADSTASPLSAYGSPFTPIAGVADQWARLSISSVSTDASDVSEASTSVFGDVGHYGALPDLYEQPWAFEFVGEIVPGGAEFLTDDFDLSKIPQVALAEVCADPAALGGVHPEPASAAAQAPLSTAHGQDPYAGLFYDGALARY